MQGETEFVVKQDGTVENSWWTPEIGEYICELCGNRGTEKCQQDVNGSTIPLFICVNANPYCG